ncbi:TcmI family type II polyketide cyclase [Actinomadura soli]|uniref:TcmI family type II polyketide cyclase n=1 Tax=Actinomadura soli TaxID=2508997 RepID=A0A5C4JGW3_9ACTN|nr:TcmI family type II polyketide cyclase [Actinomadura soli]TMR04912.1 TcmI family type II polyketide cyclase [Actinomadura soli]
MHSTLIVARLKPASEDEVARLFRDFDTTEMPEFMGTRRRQLFSFHDLYFHLQDFDSDDGGAAIQEASSHPRFREISDALKSYIDPYDPETWRSPKDAMAKRFYEWTDRGLRT